MSKYGPKKVRDMISSHPHIPMIVDDDWYSMLSEEFIHVKAGMKPNMHNDKHAIAGGLLQERGFQLGFDKLVEIVSVTAMYVCKYMDLDDLMSEISGCLKAYEGRKAAG